MSEVWVENFGHISGLKGLENHYIRFECDSSGFIKEKFFEVVDGVEKYYDNLLTIGIYHHKVDLTGDKPYQLFCSMLSGRVTFWDVCMRADEHKKTIIGYLGMAKKSEKVFKVKCNICGYETSQMIRNFYKCLGCMINSATKPYIQFVLEATKKHSGKYTYSNKGYVNGKSVVDIFCTKCQKHFKQMVKLHLIGRGCPRCNDSKGELRVAKYLQSVNQLFETQHKFPDCKYIKCLQFDFYITSLNVLIEYDGIGHYKPTFGSSPEDRQKNLEEQQKRDRAKDDWAKANNIPMLRIPYWDFDRVEELIEAFILENTKKQEIKQLELDI